ncbi:MAG: HAD-IC family P-type ATPase [Clostridia bacterium]|nr:HAD-IC family P-type ATPase [Clostridia bacterium]
MKKQKNVPVIRYDMEDGLTSIHVDLRRRQKLVNIQKVKTSKSYAAIIFKNIVTVFNIIWFCIAAILIYIGAYSDCFFLVIILANLLIGISQEIKAKKTVEKLSLITAPEAIVIRDGSQKAIPVSEVVLDDIISLEAGKEIPCDCIIKQGAIEVNESLLTGESVPVKKSEGSYIFAGSFVSAGSCIARADKIGEEMYVQQLAKKAKKLKDSKSELLKSLRFIINIIAILIVPLGLIVVYRNQLIFTDIYTIITKSAGAVIGMIPAGMFLLTSMALAVGIIRLAKHRTLVHDLYSIEMLARTTTLCLDKTGTITDGTMVVKQVITLDESAKPVGDIISSIISATKDNNQTAVALIKEFGNSQSFKPVAVLPFNSARKMSAATFEGEGTYAMGAAEFLFNNISDELKNTINENSALGYRLIGVGKSGGQIIDDTLPKDFTPLYIVLIEDHIRENAPKTIKWFNESGVKIKIISGDNPVSVAEIAKKAGVIGAEKYISLENMTDSDIIKHVKDFNVFGRVTPDQKAVIINALKAAGETVGMTGDGVNDILAMKEADCSIAMAAGSEAAINVSNLVLLDSDFSSMPQVVAEGRRVINNITKTSSMYLMKTFFVIMLVVILSLFPTDKFKFVFPFSPKQMMPLEIFVIGIPTFFLALQDNKNKITDNFLTAVVKNALPSGTVLVFNIVLLYLFSYMFSEINSQNIDTMAIYCTTFGGFIMLGVICYKFNIYRSVIFFSMLAASVLLLFLMPEFFELNSLSLSEIMTVSGLIMLNIPMLLLLLKAVKKIKI